MKSSSPLSRREFLIRTGKAVSLSAVATGTGFALHESQRFPFAQTKSKPIIRDLRIKSFKSKLIVVRGGDPSEMTKSAISAIGGINLFISKGDKVVIKPNIGWDRLPEQAANTNPFIIKTIVEECISAGASKVIVTDVTCNDASRCFARSGIAQAAEQAGASVEKAIESRFREVEMGGTVLGKRPVYDVYLDADKVINVPIAKHHSLSGVTLSYKNLYGILGGNRSQLHQDVHASVFDLGNFLRPTLTIMDAFRVLRRNGPSGGNLSDVDEVHTIIASNDPVAVDAYTSETIFNFTPDRLPYLAMAEKQGLGIVNYKAMPIQEISV